MMVDVMPFTEPVSVWRSRGRGRHSHGDGSCWSHGSSQRDTTAGGSTLKMLMSYSVILCYFAALFLFSLFLEKNGRSQLLLPVHWSIAWAWPAIQCPGDPFCTCGNFWTNLRFQVLGLVQAPCIERNSMGATKAPKKDKKRNVFHGAWHAVSRCVLCCRVVAYRLQLLLYYSVITAKFFNDVYVIIVTVTACCVRVSSWFIVIMWLRVWIWIFRLKFRLWTPLLWFAAELLRVFWTWMECCVWWRIRVFSSVLGAEKNGGLRGCLMPCLHVFDDGCNVVWKSHIVYAMIHVSMESSKVSRRLAVLWINDIEKQRSVALQLTTSDLCSKHRSCTLSKIYAVLWRLWRFLRRWRRLNDLNVFSTGTQSIWIINRWYHCFLCTWKLAANGQFIGTPRLQWRDVYWISIAA